MDVLTWPSTMPGSTATLRLSVSRSNLTLGHSPHSCCVNCWNMPGPSCRVTTLFLQLHFRFPGVGLATGLSRVTWRAQSQHFDKRLHVASPGTAHKLAEQWLLMLACVR